MVSADLPAIMEVRQRRIDVSATRQIENEGSKNEYGYRFRGVRNFEGTLMEACDFFGQTGLLHATHEESATYRAI